MGLYIFYRFSARKTMNVFVFSYKKFKLELLLNVIGCLYNNAIGRNKHFVLFLQENERFL